MRRTAPAPLALALALTALTGLTAAGCAPDPGGSGGARGASEKPAADDSPAAKALRNAVEATRGTSVKINETIIFQDEGKKILLTMNGPFDLARDRGNLVVQKSGPNPIERLDQVFAGDKVYLGTGKDRWLVTTRSKAESHYFLRAPVNDPQHLLDQIAATSKVKKASPDPVYGINATHYRGVLDHRALTVRMAAKSRDDIDALHLAEEDPDQPVSVDAYMKEGRLVLARLSYRNGGRSVHVNFALSDFGAPVTAPVPPSATPSAPPSTGAMVVMTG
ncbi:hypothetical protein OG453_08800 [Streptomyces sp. NBC_01381]|uniref:hypothetical protein n=1 Tax=Streptomyces sp. NBC_01381 TaxID=2903845 RepID=UPI00224E864B|nr:hypothetical protein [Streptomyces sp. NBC_01381]MCX4666768.1 hypothetical protein [Streptomyces sp. NBC_01381]